MYCTLKYNIPYHFFRRHRDGQNFADTGFHRFITEIGQNFHNKKQCVYIFNKSELQIECQMSNSFELYILAFFILSLFVFPPVIATAIKRNMDDVLWPVFHVP